VVNPHLTDEARAFSTRGGTVVAGRVEDLPRQPAFDLIREDFPNPPGSRVLPERRIRIGPHRSTRLRRALGRGDHPLPYRHEAVPHSPHARGLTRFLLVFEKR